MKTTKKMMLATISTVIATAANVENRDELLTFLAHEVELLDAKAERAKSAPSKPSKSVEENNAIRAAILAYLSTQTEVKTIKEIVEECAECAGASSARMGALLSPMVTSGRVKREKQGKNTVFSLA